MIATRTSFSLRHLDSATLARYRACPDKFIEEWLRDPYHGDEPYKLNQFEREFIRHAFQLDGYARLLFTLWIYAAIKKSRKTEFAQLLVITVMVLFAGTHGEAYLVGNDKEQSERMLTGIRKIIQATPLFRNEVKITDDTISFTATQSIIRAVAVDPSGIAGAHPTISWFDELWAGSKLVEKMFTELVPVPSRRISCRLVTSHAGFEDSLWHRLYLRAMAQPEVGKDLRAGDGLLCFWSHEPICDWQDARWLNEMRRELPPTEHIFKIENNFVGSTDATFISGEHWDRITTLPGPPASDPNLEICAAIDIGIKRDSTGIAAFSGNADDMRLVAHKIFVPAIFRPVRLEQVEQYLIDLSKRFKLRVVYYDPSQMHGSAERLTRLNLKMQEYTPTIPNLLAMTRTFYDGVIFERLHVYPSAELRTAVINTVAKQNASGMQIAKGRSSGKQTDIVVAMAMAATACEQQSNKIDWAHKWRAFDPSYVDPDLPAPPPQPQPAPQGNPFAGYWWQYQPQSTQKIPSPNDRLRELYIALDVASRGGFFNE